MSLPTSILLFLLGILPVTLMTGQALPSSVFYLAMATAAVMLIQQRGRAVGHPTLSYRWLGVCMAMPVLAVVLAAIWHGRLAGPSLESGLRYFFGVMLTIGALSTLKPAQIRTVFWGYLAAAIAASAYVVSLSWPDWVRPDTRAVYNAVGYGNLTLLLATLVLFSLRWKQTPWPGLERVLKLAVFVLTLAAFMLTQTRSGWVAVPVFCLIGAVLLTQRFHPRRILALTLLSLVVVSALFTTNTELRQRAVTGYHEVLNCTGEQATAVNSLCIRLQLWRAAWGMFTKRPLAGTGDTRQFGATMQQESLPEGVVSEYVATEWGEPHHDLLLALASFGVPGGLALLAVYLGPAWIFARRLAFSHPPDARTAAAMGLVVCAGFLIFGLSETMMHSMRTVGFYSLTVGILMILSDPSLFGWRAHKAGVLSMDH